ncbi:DEAD/DEAH box helicase [Pseudanabaena sp. PCC 6802]|uniref:DEAD/DEAH box helicase n=1 Tax=Pseudanabaena sp. PCC 6802 TaxID=118173 RepID=UPI000346ACAE|nr:DEAD/DEAH box helicase [Pseudanabaena sp. PCC 6802]
MTEVKLRPYQRSLVEKVFRAWQSGNRRVLMQLPTGGGKSVILSAIARELQHEGVVAIAHREELVVQLNEHLQRWCDRPVGIIKAGYPSNPLFPIQVASIQSLVRRELPKAGLAIIDEAHHSTADTYRKVLDNYPESKILGVTATPIRTDGSGFDGLFDHMVTGISVKELIADGHLCPFKLYADANPIDTRGVRTVGGDYNQKQLANAVDAALLSGNLIASYRKYADRKRCVVFAINVNHSKEICDRYSSEEISAEHLDGTTPSDERRAILDRFRSGETLVLTNCGIVSEGFDLPAIACVQIARPTKSLALWLQMVGRVLRPSHDKEYATILDHTNNWGIHGLPDANRTWTLEGVDPNTQCKRLKRSPDGEIIESEEVAIAEADCELTEISEDEARLADELEVLDRLLEVAKRYDYKLGWVAHKFLEIDPSLEALRACAIACGYKPGWVWLKFSELKLRKREAA